MVIGKIVKSNSHTDYICQVYGPGETAQVPAREDYAFGTFVQAELGSDRRLVGIIYNTQLFNPEFGRLGPRLSPVKELAIFSPDYLTEKAILVGIAAVGIIDAAGLPIQGIPLLAAHTDALVERMTEDQVRSFHQSGGIPQIAYAPLLLTEGSPLVLPLLRRVVVQLMVLFPDQASLLAVLEDDLAWRTQVTPFGGL